MEGQKPSLFISFLRYNLVALLATGLDFSLLYTLTEFLGWWYMLSTVVAAVAGAITAFLLGRFWVFVSTQSKLHHQAFRYFLVAAGSVALNSLGVYCFTEVAGFQYMVSKVFTAILVGVFYNYLLGRFFVFK